MLVALLLKRAWKPQTSSSKGSWLWRFKQSAEQVLLSSQCMSTGWCDKQMVMRTPILGVMMTSCTGRSQGGSLQARFAAARGVSNHDRCKWDNAWATWASPKLESLLEAQMLVGQLSSLAINRQKCGHCPVTAGTAIMHGTFPHTPVWKRSGRVARLLVQGWGFWGKLETQ